MKVSSAKGVLCAKGTDRSMFLLLHRLHLAVFSQFQRMADDKPTTTTSEERAHGEIMARDIGSEDANDREVDRARRDPALAYCKNHGNRPPKYDLVEARASPKNDSEPSMQEWVVGADFDAMRRDRFEDAGREREVDGELRGDADPGTRRNGLIRLKTQPDPSQRCSISVHLLTTFRNRNEEMSARPTRGQTRLFHSFCEPGTASQGKETIIDMQKRFVFTESRVT